MADQLKKHVLNVNDLEWTEKRRLDVSPDRRGFFKDLTAAHGIQQFEARITRIPPGESNTWYHTHSHCEEWFYVLRGSCHVHLNGQWSEVGEGMSLATAPGDWHTFRNFGQADCEIFMVGVNDDRDVSTKTDEPPPPAM